MILYNRIPRTGGGSVLEYLAKAGADLRSNFTMGVLGAPNPDIPIKGYLVTRIRTPIFNNNTWGWDLQNEVIDNFVLLFSEYITNVNQKAILDLHLIPMGIHKIINAPIQYMMTFREPISRAFSWYGNAVSAKHQGTKSDPKTLEWDRKYGMDIVKILESDEPALCNDQVRMIIGKSKIKLDEEDLEEAISILESDRILYANILERIDRIPKELGGILDINQEIPIRLTNTNGVRKPTKKEVIELAMEKNKVDIKLYEYLQKRVPIIGKLI